MIKPSIYRAKESCILGKVHFGQDVSIFYHATIRADADTITIGNGTNIQDNAVLHVDRGFPLVIGDFVTIGHGAILHGCTIGENTVIGMGAIILNHAQIGKNCIIGAGTLIPQDKVIPDNCVVFGNPGKIQREISEEEIAQNHQNALEYIMEAKKCFGQIKATFL